MPNTQGYTTLLDIAKHNGSDATVGLIDETTKLHPEISQGAARTIKGQSFKTWVRTGLPTAGFRNANQGVIVSKSTYENRVVETFILNPRWECDKAVADKSEDGAAAYIAGEAEGILEAAMQNLGRTFYYGRNTWQVGSSSYGGDPLGFPGLIDGFDSADYQTDAAGTTPNTGSSVWGVKWGPKNVQWVYGEEGDLSMSEVMIQRITDANGNPLTGYVQELLAYPGLQLGNLRGVIRLKNVTADVGHTLTDNMLYNLQATLPAGIMPDAWMMSRRSLAQLRASRTAVNITGQPAPLPTESGGIPIFVTDSIQNNEPINFLGI